MQAVRTHLPGVLVLALVLILLRGPSGTIEALRVQLATFVGSFLGTGDGLGAVVLHTLPRSGFSDRRGSLPVRDSL